MRFKKTLLALWLCNLLFGFAHADEIQNPPSRQHTKKSRSHAIEVIAEKLDLNQASETSLAQIPGLSVNKAKAIVAYRKKHGNFQSVAGLAKVKGFKRLSADNFEALAKHLTVLTTTA